MQGPTSIDTRGDAVLIKDCNSVLLKMRHGMMNSPWWMYGYIMHGDRRQIRHKSVPMLWGKPALLTKVISSPLATVTLEGSKTKAPEIVKNEWIRLRSIVPLEGWWTVRLSGARLAWTSDTMEMELDLIAVLVKHRAICIHNTIVATSFDIQN